MRKEAAEYSSNIWGSDSHVGKPGGAPGLGLSQPLLLAPGRQLNQCMKDSFLSAPSSLTPSNKWISKIKLERSKGAELSLPNSQGHFSSLCFWYTCNLCCALLDYNDTQWHEKEFYHEPCGFLLLKGQPIFLLREHPVRLLSGSSNPSCHAGRVRVTCLSD